MSHVTTSRPVEDVAVVTLDRPDRLNTMAFDVVVALREALGRDVDAGEAERIGLVSHVADDARDAALATAAMITRHSAVGVELTKRLAWQGLESNSLANTVDAEGTAQLYPRVTTKNFEEAVAARAEGRDPAFRD